MRGYQHLQFAEDGNLIGLKRTQNKIDEIDPATGKALSSHPVLIEGKPFESKEFQEGEAAFLLSGAAKHFIRSVRTNERAPKVVGDYEVCVFDRATGARKLRLENIPSDTRPHAYKGGTDRYLIVRDIFFRANLELNATAPFKVFDLAKGTLIGRRSAEVAGSAIEIERSRPSFAGSPTAGTKAYKDPAERSARLRSM